MQRVYSFKKRVREAVETQNVPDPEMVLYFDNLPYQYENPFHSWAHLFMSSNVRQHYNFARLWSFFRMTRLQVKDNTYIYMMIMLLKYWSMGNSN